MSYEADYVVVGAGAAGAVLAARLAEDGKRTVILIEAGPDNTTDPTIMPAAKFAFLLDMPAPVGPEPSPTHWGFISEQNGKRYCYPRGTGLGGSTNHHAMVDGRGSPLIYNEWAKQTGDERWTYERLLPYFVKMENYSDIPYVDDRVHGKKGWLHIKRAKLEKGFHPDFLAVAMQDFGMPFRHDFYDNPNNFSGIGWTDMQVHKDGRRSNAAVDLLLPQLETSKKGVNNLQILTDKLAAKVIFEKTRAVGVEVIDAARAYKVDVAYRPESKSAKHITIKAKKEVIISGGAINTPQLLMLSGIGPKEELTKHGIALVKELPGVGAHLQDHSEVGHIFQMKNLPDKVFRWQNTFLAEAAPHYAARADTTSFTENYVPIVFDWYSGVDAPNPMHPDLHIHLMTVFFRDFNIHPERYKDTDSNKGSWLNDFVAMVDAKAPKAFHTFLIECVKPAPTKGRIGLNSADPTEPPLIDMQLFGADADVTRVAKGIELVRQIMSHPTIQQYGPEEVLPGFGYKTTDQIKDYLRKYSSFGHHMSGTAKMGKPTDPMAVVDSHLEVIGVEGLRVCDTSVFPEIPAYNTSRPAYLVGEVLADLMTK
jgi:choline dehydrogenase-like flavoprotein